MSTSSKYLIHPVMPNIGATGVHLVADVAAVQEEYNSANTAKAVMVDNTCRNTSFEAGMVTILEKKLKGKCTPLAVYSIKNFQLEPSLKQLMKLQEALLFSLAIWGNFAEVITMICPK